MALRKWVACPQFNSLLQRFVDGEKDFSASEVLDSFLDGGEFHYEESEQQTRVATAVLSRFFTVLNEEILKGEQGHVILDARAEARHQELLSVLRVPGSGGNPSSIAATASTAVQLDLKSGDPPRDDRHPAITAQVDMARDLLNDHRVRSARAVLERIDIADVPLQLHTKFRIKTNLAYCSLAEGDHKLACKLIDEAREFAPENDVAIANSALAAQIRGKTDLAIELCDRAIHSNAKNSRANGVLIRAFWERNETEKLEAWVASNEWILEDEYCAAVLAEIRWHQHKLDDAKAIIDAILDGGSDDPSVRLLQASVALGTAQHQMRSGAKVIEVRDEFSQAKCAASYVIESIGLNELDQNVISAFILRSQVNAFLGLSQSALEDVEHVLSRDSANLAARTVKGMILVDKGQMEEAVEFLRPVPGTKTDAIAVTALAEAEIATGNPSAAIELLSDVIDYAEPEWGDVIKTELLTRAEIGYGENRSVSGEIARALRKSPKDPRKLAMAAICKDAQNDSAAAIRWANRASDHSSEIDQKQIGLIKGVLFRKLNRFGDAADEFESVIGGDPYHPIGVDLLICLVNSKRFRRAVDWAQAIRRHWSELPKLALEAEASLYEFIGDMESAIGRRVEICQHPEATSVDSVKLAAAYIRVGELQRAAETTKQVDVWTLTNSPNEIIRLAHLKRHLLVDGYMEDAYVGRQLGRHDPTVHMGYLALFVSEENEFPTPEQVSIGHAIRLKTSDVEQWWLIEEDPKLSVDLRGMTPSDDLAQLLLGKKVGDVIEFNRGLESVDYEILEIQSKLVRAFQETAAEFSARFPKNMSMQAIEIAGDDFTNLFKLVYERNRYATSIEGFYEGGQLPFTTFCDRIGRPVVEVWKECVTSGAHQIHFALGTAGEAKAASNALAQTDEVILDSLALFAVHELGMREALCRRFARVFVPQHIIDDLVQCSAEANLKAPSGHIGVDRNGGHFLVEVNRTSWEERRDYLASVAEFAESFERIACYPLLDEECAEDLFAALAPPGVGALFAGNHDEQPQLRVLVCDDLVLNNLAIARNLATANTQSLLEELIRNELISPAQYSTSIERLAECGYQHIRVNVDDIVHSYRVNGFASTAGTRALLGSLSVRNCPIDAAASVGSGVIHKLATQAPPRQMQLILMAVATELRNRPDGILTISRFKDAIASRFSQNPNFAIFITNTVDLLVHFGDTFSSARQTASDYCD